MRTGLITVGLSVIALFCISAKTGERSAVVNSQNGKDTLTLWVPSNFPQPVYGFKENTPTEAGFELGRTLFYDPVLSRDNSISCANCHQSFAAFAQLDHDFSHGVDNCEGTRNTPPIFNIAWQKEFMWDGGVNHIELSPLNALTNSCEMANSLDTIVKRLSESSAYPALFNQTFGSKQINSQRILRALAQFTSMLVSANSRYDHFVRGEQGGTLDAREQKGYAIFKEKCSSCHTEPLFTDLSYRNNGLDEISADPGRDTITGLVSDKGKFKVPSLRNIALTAPYMHDGRFKSMEEVLKHYAGGMKPHANLDASLNKNKKPGIELTSDEQQQVIVFLRTLTDTTFIKDKRFQQPQSIQK